MRRRWNAILWIGFAVVAFAAFSYVPLFARFPSTRDVPWVNLALFAAGGVLIADGLGRAWRNPQEYRGRIAGIALAAVAAAVFGFFLFGTFHFARQLPQSMGAPAVGQKAPELSVIDSEGRPQTLSSLASSRAVLLIFDRGFW